VQAITGNRTDDPVRRKFPDAVVPRICNIEIAGGIERDAAWVLQLRTGRLPTIACIALDSVAGDRSDGSAGRDLPNSSIVVSAMKTLPVLSTATPDGAASCAFERRSAIAGITPGGIARHSGDDSAGGNLADDVQTSLGNEKVSQAVRGQRPRTVQQSGGCWHAAN